MSTSETKIELVTEAIEALVLASIVATTPGKERAADMQNLHDARDVLKASLKELLAPTLRVVK
jgi:hypothetical protein